MDPSKSNSAENEPLAIKMIHLVNNGVTSASFEDARFEITYRDTFVKIESDPENHAILRLKDQKVSYKATLLGGFTLAEEKKGNIDYSKYLSIEWEDDFSLPRLHFERQPMEITRRHKEGQWIELGSENVAQYRVVYRDGVEASFDRKEDGCFVFSFSTGFYGAFQEEPDGSYTLTFKGDRLKPGEDNFRSQSKFIVSRSKYTGKLLLVFQDEAVVYLT